MTKEKRSEKDELAQVGGGPSKARTEAMVQLQQLEEKMLNHDDDRRPAASGITPHRQSGEPRQQLMQLEQEVLNKKTSSLQLSVSQLEASPSVPPLVAQEARAALQLLESKCLTSQESSRSLTAAERATQELEAKAVNHDPTTNTTGATAQDQMRNALSQLESKATAHDSTSATKEPRAALHQLESKFTTGSEFNPTLAQSGAGSALRSSLNQLESKFVATQESHPPSPSLGADLRSSLNQLESKFSTGNESNPQSQPGASLRSSFQQVESKFTSNETTASAAEQARQLLYDLEREVRVGAVAVTSGVASAQVRESLNRVEAKLKKDIGATNSKEGTAVAVSSGHVSAQARESLHRMEAKLEKELGTMPMGGTAVAVSSAQVDGVSVGSSSVSPAAASSLHRLQEKLEHDNLLAPAASSPDVSVANRLERMEEKLVEQNMVPGPSTADATHAALERRLNTLEEKAVAAYPTGLNQQISEEEMLEHKLLDKHGVKAKDHDLLALENTLEETAFAASRRGDGNAGAFANEPSDALPGHGPRNPRPQTANQQQPSLDRQMMPNERLGHFQVEAGLYELDAEEGLAEAILVNEDKEHLPVGVPEDDNADMENKERMDEKRSLHDWLTKLGLVGCILVVIVVVIVVVVVRTNNNENSKSLSAQGNLTNSPTLPPSLAPTPYIISLPDYTLVALQDAESPQSQAYRWLREDPFLEDYTESRISQRMALATLFYATKGQNWTINDFWLSYTKPECTWFSKYEIAADVTGSDTNNLETYAFTTADQLVKAPVCDEDENYQALVLKSNQLVGTLPGEVALLTKLHLIDVSDNQLQDTIPTQLGLMKGLKELSVGLNLLTGALPTEIGNMSDLEALLADEIPISGTLPSQLGQLTALNTLDIKRTEVTSTIPKEIYGLKNLTFLALYDNLLTGTLPSEVGLLGDSLQTIRIKGNSLSGTLPSELGLLTKLTYLGLDRNQFIGTIPTHIGTAQNLNQFWLEHNKISGSIPSILGSMMNLTLLTFADNLFTGALPLGVWQLPNTIGLGFSRNPFLEGYIPTEVGLASNIQVLFFYDLPKWGGTIPSELGLLERFGYATFSRSNYTGTIPKEILTSKMVRLKLNDNPLTGTVPYQGNESRMEILWLNNTLLTGQIPDVLCGTPDLLFDCPSLCGCDCSCDDDPEWSNNATVETTPRWNQSS